MKRQPKTSNSQLEFMWGEPEPTQEIVRECEYGLSLGGRPANLGPPLMDDDKALIREMATSDCSMEEFMRRYGGVSASSKIRRGTLGDAPTSEKSWPSTGIVDGDGNVVFCRGSEFISNPVFCSLSDVLEPNDERAAKYFLTHGQVVKMLCKLYRHGGKGPKPEIMEASGVTQADLDAFVASHPDGRYYGHPSYSNQHAG